MVRTNSATPEPDNPTDDVKYSNDVIIISDDESDQEVEMNYEPESAQYQPLPTSPNEEQDTSDNEDEHDEASYTPVAPDVPPIVPIETDLLKEVWAGPSPEICDIKMDSEKVQEVKQAMLNITLPDSAIPDWAVNIPEEEWKSQLINKLKK